jgi:hypothetical protein
MCLGFVAIIEMIVDVAFCVNWMIRKKIGASRVDQCLERLAR